MHTLAWKAAYTETASGTDTSTATLTATYTPTMTISAIPTEEPPGPFSSASYTYDGDDNMVKSVINGITTYYASSSYVMEVDGSDTTVRKTYTAGGTSLAVRTIVNESTETLNWLLSDHLGSSSITTTADGTWTSEIRYSAFGETRYSSGITPTDYRYTGQLEQADVNLYYYNARYYDAALGRFIQADTIIPGAGDSKSYDRYAYVNNNPLKFTDPSGNHPCTPGDPDYNSQSCISYMSNSSSGSTETYKRTGTTTPQKYRVAHAPDSYVVAGGTYSDKINNAAAKPGPPVLSQLPNWDSKNPYNLSKYEPVQYPGNITDEMGNQLTAKYAQSLELEQRALSVDVAIIGYSGGGDSALIYAENHQVAGLVLLDPTGTGNMRLDGSQGLSPESAKDLMLKLANEDQVRIVLVDDSGKYRDYSSELNSSDNILYIGPDSESREHWSENVYTGSGTNASTELINQSWDFLMTGEK
ncbi:MAG: alpha/beta hydrolase [Anaerolineaceae bacterium]|nr:alpha/beta hydrolase [Anaerolineaceae bacterium]